MMYKIFIANEQPVILAGLRMFFGSTEFRVVGDAQTGKDLLRGIEQTGPQFVIVNLDQASFEGVEAKIAKKVQSGRWNCRLIPWNASLHSIKKEQLLQMIRQMLPKPASAKKRPKRGQPALPTLTPREQEVIRLIVQGLTNKEIARQLGIALETVKEHVGNILRKINLQDRTQAAIWAVRNNVVAL